MPRKPKKIHYIYKTTCSLTKRFYIGMRSTDTLPEKYLGSGTELSKSVKTYGRENHTKEILEYLPNRKELKVREKELITEELRKDPMCLNLAKGGQGSDYACDLVSVIDKAGNTFSCHKDDPRYLNGEVNGVTVDLIPVKDKDGNTFSCHKDDPKYLSGELISMHKNTVTVKDDKGLYSKVNINDPRYLNGILVHMNTGLVTVKDIDDNRFFVNINDPRYLSGELVHIWKGKTHTNETKKKMSLSQKGKQIGALNSQYGKCWITNGKESKKIYKGDSLPNGWKLGRTLKIKRSLDYQ